MVFAGGWGTYEHFSEGWVRVKEESVLEVERSILAIVHLVKPASYVFEQLHHLCHDHHVGQHHSHHDYTNHHH